MTCDTCFQTGCELSSHDDVPKELSKHFAVWKKEMLGQEKMKGKTVHARKSGWEKGKLKTFKKR